MKLKIKITIGTSLAVLVILIITILIPQRFKWGSGDITGLSAIIKTNGIEEPYETKSFYFEITVTDDLTEYNGYYRFFSFAGIDIYEPHGFQTYDLYFSRFSMMIKDLPIQIKKDE